MNYTINGINIFTIVFVCFATALVLTPVVKKIAFHVGAIDMPDGKRKIHTKPMPRMGGLAMFFAFLLGYMLFAPKTTQMLSILIGAMILMIVGFMDDIKSLPPAYKFIGQVIAACVLVFYGNITLSNMVIFRVKIDFGVLAPIFTIFFVVGIINAINFADGLDGLAAGTSTIYFITVAILGFILNKLGGLDVIICLIMIGACLGFLVFNFNPASIFMGDTGSMFLGYVISAVALLGFKTATITSLIIPILVLFVPILDTLLAMARRLIKGDSIGHADKEHLHHQLLRGTKSVRKTVIIMYLINILFASVSILYTLGDKKQSMILYAVLLLALLVLILNTNILFDKEHAMKNSEEDTKKGKKNGN